MDSFLLTRSRASAQSACAKLYVASLARLLYESHRQGGSSSSWSSTVVCRSERWEWSSHPCSSWAVWATGNRGDNSCWRKQRFQQPESPSRTSQHPVPVPSHRYYAHQLLPLTRVTFCWWSGTPLNGGDNSGWSFEHGYVCFGQYPPDQRHPNKRVNPSLVCRWLKRGWFLACSHAMVGQAHRARPQVWLLSESCQNSRTFEGGKDVRSHHHVPKFWNYHHVWRPTLSRRSPWRRWHGYFPKAVKTAVLLKEEKMSEATTMFQNSGITITCDGRRCLGAALGGDGFQNQFVSAKISQWVSEVEKLAQIAKTQPQPAYAVFTHDLIGPWVYSTRVSAISSAQL